MNVLTLKRRALDWKQFVRRRAAEADTTQAVTEPCKVFDTAGNLVCIYDVIPTDTTALATRLKQVEYQTSTRTGGMVTTSRIFGSQPRLERRQRSFCTRASMNREFQEQAALIYGAAQTINAIYERQTPEVFTRHKEFIDAGRVKEDWLIPGTVFTSGIINRNNALAYHFDAGNFESVLSCMLVLRDQIQGGWLSCPEFDVRFLLQNNAIFMFDGQSILHGVTPMEPTGPEGYRFSIVLYSLKGMWKCLTLTEELAHARQVEIAKLTKPNERADTQTTDATAATV